jgi:hypothetical protein
MTRICRTLLVPALGAAALLAGGCGSLTAAVSLPQPELGVRSKPVRTIGKLRFRDLDNNGALDPYEDWRLSPEQRAADLITRMTLEEKAGTLMHGTAQSTATTGVSGGGSAYNLDAARTLIVARHVTSAISRLALPPEQLATQNNQLQEIAEGARLGIPMTLSTDPRHHFQFTAGAAVASTGFSQWPEMLGLAAIGDAAQRRALVLLDNPRQLLPWKPAAGKVFLHGISADAARHAGFAVTDKLDDAALAIIRTQTPFQLLHPGYAFGSIQHEGDLDFKPGDPTLAVIQAASRKVPTVVTVMLDRPAILTNVKPLVAAMFGDFGISDEALLDVIAGRAQPEGRLPFELPSSMQAVRQQKSDLPFDSLKPLYPFGYGLRYSR